MQIGLVGLGKMGFNMRERLRAHGHEVVGYDPRPEVTDVASLAELAQRLESPRVVWVMVPAGKITQDTVTGLASVLESGDLVIDGGNSRYTETRFTVSCSDPTASATSTAVCPAGSGDSRTATLMVGGSAADVERALPIFDALRPEGERADGFVHAGPIGAGHYAKMIHNGIEYGLMQAYAEGYELLEAEDLVTDVHGVLRAWTNGTVVRSWLLELLVKALGEDPDFAEISGYTDDSGEGRWTVLEAIDHAVPAPVISAALFARFASRQDDSPAMKAVSALRNQFGGHAVKKAAGEAEAGSGT